MKFRYLKFNLKRPSSVLGRSILKPIIPVRIRFRENSLKYAALIDSGADFCIFDAEIGEYLGIDISSGQKEEFGGIQEHKPSVAYFHKITLDIGGWDYPIVAGFSYDIARRGYAVLGQKGFFDKFVVKFDFSKGEIGLKPKR